MVFFCWQGESIWVNLIRWTRFRVVTVTLPGEKQTARPALKKNSCEMNFFLGFWARPIFRSFLLSFRDYIFVKVCCSLRTTAHLNSLAISPKTHNSAQQQKHGSFTNPSNIGGSNHWFLRDSAASCQGHPGRFNTGAVSRRGVRYRCVL